MRPRLRSGLLGTLLAATLAGTLWGWFHLDLELGDLRPRSGGAALLRDLASAALQPAWSSQDPAGTSALMPRLLGAAWNTVAFAATALALALVLGLPLGVLACSSWWSGWRRGPFANRGLAAALWAGARSLAVVLRSVHELLWAVLLLALFGLQPATGILALALPYAGGLAKVFSEMIDEADPAPGEALRALGASGVRCFLFARLPAAAPDLIAYAFYRLECGLRSSAVLGFFGFQTLGLSVRQSFQNLHFRELWTGLYLLLALVLVFELWSSQIRRRLQA